MQEATKPPQEPGVQSGPVELSPGVATLFRGKGQSVEQPAPEPRLKPEPASLNWGFRIPLLLADVLLIVLASKLVLKGQGTHPSLMAIAACILAFGLGAWLACLALWPRRD
jgi:hypothetical protein